MLKLYLQASRLNFTTQCHLLILNLMELNRVEWTNNFADYIVARISIEAQHHKMQWHGLKFIHRQAVEREILFIDRVASVADDSVMEGKCIWLNCVQMPELKGCENPPWFENRSEKQQRCLLTFTASYLEAFHVRIKFYRRAESSWENCVKVYGEFVSLIL